MNSKDKEYLANIKIDFNGLNYKELYDKLEKEGIKGFKIVEEKNHYIVQQNEEEGFHIFFKEFFTVLFQNVEIEGKRRNTEINNVCSTQQIENYYNEMNILNPLIIVEKSKCNYYYEKINLYLYIRNNYLTIYNDYSEFNTFILNNKAIKTDNFQSYELSKYFNEYFIYNDINNDKSFKYDNTENRKLLTDNYLKKLCFYKDLKYFMVCGPTSTGKSLTMLKFSREMKGVIYLNLKKIKKLEEENLIYDCYNLIIYEFGRLYFPDENNIEDLRIKLHGKLYIIF